MKKGLGDAEMSVMQAHERDQTTTDAVDLFGLFEGDAELNGMDGELVWHHFQTVMDSGAAESVVPASMAHGWRWPRPWPRTCAPIVARCLHLARWPQSSRYVRFCIAPGS